MREWLAVCFLLTSLLFASPVSAQSARNANDVGAWTLIDQATGAVVDAHNDRERLPPASVTKMMTALVVVDRLRGNPQIPVSFNAARMPASKLDLKQGEVWPKDVLLNAMMLASANDAAVALAEATAGDLDKFAQFRSDAAAELGLQDSPVFNDPAGLDDAEWSSNGGDLVSSRDLGIIARAILASPELASIAARQRFDFIAPNGTARYVINHNRMLATYPGSIGLKTGYTTKARHTFAAAATRNGRTMIAIVLDAPSPYPKATELLDKGFAMPVVAGPTNDVLPLPSLEGAADQQISAAPASSSIPVSPGAIAGSLAVVGYLALRTRARRTRRRCSSTATGS